MARILVLLVFLLAACGGPTSSPVGPNTESGQSTESSQFATFTWGGIERAYRVHLPKDYNASATYPVLLVLHGANGSSTLMERSTEFDALADERGFIVVYGDGTKAGARGARVWNAGGCCGYAADAYEAVDDVGYAREVVARVSRDHDVDPARVFVTGISNGAMMAHRLACEASEVFRGMAAVAGTISVETCDPAEKLPVLLINGTADKNIPYAGNTVAGIKIKSVPQVFAEWGSRDGCAGKPVGTSIKNIDVITFPRCVQPVQLIRINGGTHNWPAGAAERITNFFGI